MSFQYGQYGTGFDLMRPEPQALRFEELLQLHVEDVRQEEGIWCISINDASEDEANPKKLKNKASERLIPVHNALIRLGFIDFVNKQSQDKHIRLFPELKHGIDGFSRLTSRWFNDGYLRKTMGIMLDAMQEQKLLTPHQLEEINELEII